MTEEEKNTNHIMRTIGVVLATFIGAFLAFYCVMDITFNRMFDPNYQFKKMEKMIQHHEREIFKMEDKFFENPFEPKLAPMLVNLVKEEDEYKIIVDLKQINDDEKNINVKIDNNVVTVSGAVDKSKYNKEEILDFTQSFHLSEKPLPDKMTKERRGSKYIITIPFEE